jgi:release factor glutamine methyltransferase
MNGQEVLRLAVPRLRDAGIADAVRDARVLLAYAIGVASDRLTLHLPDVLDDAAVERFNAALSAREQRQPVSQITGQRLFWGQSFLVTPDVLDPRPETEGLVAAALVRPFVRILDLGTGSGCVLLSCLSGMQVATGLGVDVSQAALLVARRNAERLNLGARSQFAVSDWCKQVSGRFDLIVSNPPYIAAIEMASLAPEVRNWEPHLALTPGGDGLDAYRAIAVQTPARLLSGGRIMVEIGPTQATAVAQLFTAQGLSQIEVRRDFDGRDRVVMAVKSD